MLLGKKWNQNKLSNGKRQIKYRTEYQNIVSFFLDHKNGAIRIFFKRLIIYIHLDPYEFKYPYQRNQINENGTVFKSNYWCLTIIIMDDNNKPFRKQFCNVENVNFNINNNQ